MDEILRHIKKSFNDRVEVKKKRPGIYQLFIPVYHEDGDMVEIYIEQYKNGKFKLCDYGMTLMRLSYYYEIDTENKEKILRRIINENQLEEENGNIYFITKHDTIYSDILHIIQAYMKIGSMKYFKREIIESLFFEMLDDYIQESLSEYSPQKNVLPIEDRDDLEADWSFKPNGYPIYLFGVKDSNKARLATISCLEYEKANLKFRSLIVHEDFEKLSKKDRSRLTNVSDKQFTSLQNFKYHAKKFFEKEKNI